MKIQLLRFVLKLTSYLPLKLAHWIGSLIGWIYQIKPSKMKRVAERNIQRCFPELEPSQQHQLLQDSLLETGKLLSEMGIMWGRSAHSVLALVKSVEGAEDFPEGGAKEIGSKNVSSNDTVVGIAACGVTPAVPFAHCATATRASPRNTVRSGSRR